ncbi:hypothetical protein BHM03_00008296 [Ensete ventricosum]|nr:hypothetical protein BHM03_00008296 [Ensete ventricosum]
MLDPHTAAWVAEFVLRQPVEDWLAHEIFFLLPLPSPPPLCLRRTILLRRLASDLTRRSPSLRTLHSLDLLLDDRPDTSSSSESMAAAYRAVALHCVIDALSISEDNGSFRAFVEGLCSRVAYLERLGPAILAAEPLRELRMEIEPAAGSGFVRASLLDGERDTRQEALDAIRVYLKSATEELGPPFLELTADIVVRNGIELGGPSGEAFTEMGEKDEDSGIKTGVEETTFGLSDAVLDHGVKGEVILLETDREISSTVVDHGVNLEVVFLETNQQISSVSGDTSKFSLIMIPLKIL